MKYSPFILLGLALLSCNRPKLFDDAAALAWSKKPEVQTRSQSASYAFQRSDGSWVSISTAKMSESETALVYSGGEVLRTGFLTYPGGQTAASIEEAIQLCNKLAGAKYKPKQ
jgi:hypothetical protein